MAIDCDDNNHVVACDHGKALQELDQTTHDVTRAPVSVRVLPDQLRYEGEYNHKKVSNSEMENKHIYARIVSVPGCHAPLANHPQNDQHASNETEGDGKVEDEKTIETVQSNVVHTSTWR